MSDAATKRRSVEANFRALFRSYKRHAKKKNRTFQLTPEQFREITKSNCYICGAKPANKYRHDSKRWNEHPYTYNGVDRFNSRKGYVEGNVIACCWVCNRAKGPDSIEKFLLYILRAYNHIIKPALLEGVPDVETD